MLMDKVRHLVLWSVFLLLVTGAPITQAQSEAQAKSARCTKPEAQSVRGPEAQTKSVR